MWCGSTCAGLPVGAVCTHTRGPGTCMHECVCAHVSNLGETPRPPRVGGLQLGLCGHPAWAWGSRAAPGTAPRDVQATPSHVSPNPVPTDRSQGGGKAPTCLHSSQPCPRPGRQLPPPPLRPGRACSSHRAPLSTASSPSARWAPPGLRDPPPSPCLSCAGPGLCAQRGSVSVSCQGTVVRVLPLCAGGALLS